MRPSIRRASPPSRTKNLSPSIFAENEETRTQESGDASSMSTVEEQPPAELIEVCSTGTSSRHEVTNELVETYIENDYQSSQSGLPDATNQPESETIKLFFSKRVGPYNKCFTPIPWSQHLYTRIAPFARISDVYLSVLGEQYAAYLFTQPRLPVLSSPNSHHNTREDYLSFIFQSCPGGNAWACASASFTYHFPSRRMYIFMRGLQGKKIDQFSHEIQGGAANVSAFLIPSMMIRYNLDQIKGVMDWWNTELFRHENTLGIHIDQDDDDVPDLVSLDFTPLRKSLNRVNTDIAWNTYLCKGNARKLEFLDAVTDRYQKQATAHGEPEDDVSNITHILSETHAALRCLNTELQDEAEYLAKRGQVMFQTVYSAIAQRDSAHNLSLARSSRSLAISTSRDSAVMKIIAAITIFFLPATFVATFFSTSFFDFNSNLNGRIYSDWMWLYFLVTLILTVVVMVGTWVVWREKEKSIQDLWASPDDDSSSTTTTTTTTRTTKRSTEV